MKIFKCLIIVAVTIIVFGCQYEADDLDMHLDKEYLSLPEGADLDNLTDSEIKIVMKAFSRMRITESQYGICSMVESAEEANVSEDIFEIYVRMINKINDEISNGVIHSRNTMLSSTEGSSSSQTPSDCVARSISAATGQKYDGVNSWIVEKCGSGGVSPSEFYEVASHFGEGQQISNDQLRYGNYGSDSKIVIVIDNRHAVNLFGASNGYITYWDYQTGLPGYVDISKITHAYQYN